MTPLRIGVAGCGGRMGMALVRLAAADPALELVAAVTRKGEPCIGDDAGANAGLKPLGVTITDSIHSPPDVLIEFTEPAGCVAWAEWCESRGVRLVSGTTGLGPEEQAALKAASARTAVLWSPNMSVGVNLILQLAKEAAARLGAEWDIEIVESHHRHKADAPSGTAKALLEAVCAVRGDRPEDVVRHGRAGIPGPRGRSEIGVHALRLGDVVGEHELHFAVPGEMVTLRHRASSRDAFAAGALRAAKWLSGKPAGLYHMRDVLA